MKRILAVAAALAFALGVPAAAASSPTSYSNAVSKGFADTFADPVIIRGEDGRWYSYGTSDPLREGEGVFHRIPTAVSDDLVNWSYEGDALESADVPAYAEPDTSFWAPDVRYLDGRYVMYYTVTDTKVAPGWTDFAIGVATAPSPTGPWTHSDTPVVPPRPAPSGGWWGTIDPSQFTDADGAKYLYFGGYFGGIWVTELSADGLRAVGEPTRVTIDNKFEGGYVVRHDGWYYLFGSSANCCAGPTTGYAVFAGRSKSPRGPFVDASGTSLDTSRAGGTPVVAQNGNTWIGPGHNGLVTDLAGQDWFVYHAIDRRDPYLDQPHGVNERPMLIDRLDWIDGWPVVRAGAGPSEGAQPAPVTTGPVHETFDSGLGGWETVSGEWSVSDESVRQTESGKATRLLTARAEVPDDMRAEADVRLAGSGADAVGLAVRHMSPGHSATVWLDRSAGALVAEVVDGARRTRARAPLPGGFSYDAWHNLAVEARGDRLVASVTDARLGDPQAEVSLRLPAGLAGGQVGIAARGAGASADNVSAAPLFEPVTERAPTPQPGAPLAAHSDEFDGASLGEDWSWVREDPDAVVGDGGLTWPTQADDLVGDDNQAGVLLRDAPSGDYIVEAKLSIDLGVDTIRNYQQAGLVAYADDDHFARLSHVAIWNTRQVEFGKEMPFADGLAFGGNIVGPPAETTWLRLAHRVDPDNGEHEYRAASSRDGETWVWGGVWTLPAGADPKIGLVSHGGDSPQGTAVFDHLRMYEWN
ncbi:MAG: family 43 glycosylhydrolase [Micromonosporaceae bacterium]|nr:family 43 glycosylhydrolase [Micromonosporaceae bacterium]